MDSSMREKLDAIIAVAKQQKKEYDRKEIKRKSPYSDMITKYISSVNEVKIYVSCGLAEGFVTRPSLTMVIDPDYIAPGRKNTNRERMMKGFPPYDPATGEVIKLHHMRQEFDSPFAELPHSIHIGNKYNSTLHHIRGKDSWRCDKKKEAEFQKQKKEYWKKRIEDMI